MTIDRRFGVRDGQAIKTPCRVATTANLSALSGLLTIDTVTVADGDRVLVKDQDTATENGIYVASTGLWERATDFNGYADVVKGTYVFINEGDTNTGLQFRVTSSDPIVIGTSDIEFESFFVAGPPNSLSIGTVTEGATAAATITGSPPTQVLNLTLPQATDGADATIEVGTVTTLAAGEPATVTNSGTTTAAVFDFGIPAGQDGDKGTNGATWRSGATDPGAGLGSDGDFYLQTGSGATGVLGDVWEKVSGTWVKGINIRGASGAGTGDMLAATYDPNSKAADAFNTDNHADGTTNKVYSATDKSKLAGIEALADVTDATNVAAAGAVMDGDFSADGLMTRTASGTYTSRTLTAGTGVTITNGDGVAANPQIALSAGTQASLALADTALQPGDVSAYAGPYIGTKSVTKTHTTISPAQEASGTTNYTGFPGTAPTTSNRRHKLEEFTIQATQAGGATFEVHYQAYFSGITGGTGDRPQILGCVLDSNTDVADYGAANMMVNSRTTGTLFITLYIAVADTSLHDVDLFCFRDAAGNLSVSERTLTVVEMRNAA